MNLNKNAVALNPVFSGGNNPQIVLDMKPGNKFTKQRVDVVNVVGDSGLLGNSPALVIKTQDGRPVCPFRRSSSLGCISPNVVLVADRKAMFGGPEIAGKFAGRPAVAVDPLGGSGSSPLMRLRPSASIRSGSPGGHVRPYAIRVLFAPSARCGVVAGPALGARPSKQLRGLLRPALGTFHHDHRSILS